MNRLRAVLVAVALLAALAPPALAQLPGLSLTLEVTPTAGVAMSGFAASHPGPEAGSGVGIGGGGTLGVGDVFALYAGYHYLRFACNACEGGGLMDALEDLGWEAGVQLTSPLGALGVRPWLRAGAIGHQLQFTGTSRVASEPAIGVSVGAGTDLPILGPLLLLPAVRYRAYTADFRFSTIPTGGEGSTRSTDVSYLTVDLGLGFRF